MTGPEHYAEAERLLDGDEYDVRAALIHALLANTAAVIDVGLRDASVVRGWNVATGVHRD